MTLVQTGLFKRFSHVGSNPNFSSDTGAVSQVKLAARLDAKAFGACQGLLVHPGHVLLVVGVELAVVLAFVLPLDQLHVLYAVRRRPDAQACPEVGREPLCRVIARYQAMTELL